MPNASTKITDDVTRIGPLSVKWKTKAGHDAAVDGDTVFASSNEDTAKIDDAKEGEAPGLYLQFGELGKAQLTATADADLGEGIKPVVAAIDIEYVAGEAFSGVIDLGTPSA